MKVLFTVNGVDHEHEGKATDRLLDILREDLALTGTKEGCGEGECGSCVVILNGKLVNSCLVPLLQLDGATIETIEGLGTQENPHVIQKAFMDEGSVQCGFCIPGMVLATKSLLDENPQPERKQIAHGLAGNLCRCTGYEKIFRAVENAAVHYSDSRTRTSTIQSSPQLMHEASLSLEEVLKSLHENAGSLIICGATDFLLEEKHKNLNGTKILDISRIPELSGIAEHNGFIEIGATTTFTDIASSTLILEKLPVLYDMANDFASPPIRNRATLGGNICTASPSADSVPALFVLDASFILQSCSDQREVRAVDFFSGYRRTVKKQDELVTRIKIPLPDEHSFQQFYKVGTRKAQAISKVSLAALATVGENGVIQTIRFAAGSVGPLVLSLEQTALHLVNKEITEKLSVEAAGIAMEEVTPIDDVRSTEKYRRMVIRNLVKRYLHELLCGKGKTG